MDIRECYSILKIDRKATYDDLKAAFRKRAFELHPDLNPDDPNAHSNFQKLNEAYVLLREALKNDPPRSAKRTHPKQGKPKADKGTGAKRYQEQAKKSTSAKPGATKKEQPGKGAGNFFFKKEDVLKNILNDPFARKVFEDIYSEIKNTKGKVPATVRKRNLALRWGEKEVNFDLTFGLWGGTKNWMKNQMDDEQTVYLAPNQLLPGSRIRLQIRRAWSGEPITVEVPIPADYVVGRALRLRGLGRHLGPFKGDLYLRLLAK